MLHFIKAMLSWISNWLIAHVPFTGKIRGIAIFLKEFSDSGCFFAEIIFIAWANYNRQGRTNRNTSRHEGSAACGTACLTIPTGEYSTFPSHAVHIGRRMTEGSTAA